ncbi:ATP-dependent DNA helicase UvrD2 [Nocardioides sp. KR10-350]|uniref:ATP-dependent DNA helicase UvrD2 n=1 Tax=Nocardioides cheoyonin TaxID=3156615 RepID=UPI0032B3A403
MTPEDLLSALDPEQRRVAEALRGPVRVLAGAGTGKTRAITHRIAYGVATGVYAPTEMLAVTFTTRAAGEMRQRLRAMGAGAVQARTFHSAALRQLRYFWPKAYGTELPTLTESKIPLLAQAARRQRVHADQALLRDLASEVEWAKVSNVHPDDYAKVAAARRREVTGTDPATVGHVFAAYEETKRSQGRMDMEDVLLLTAGLLSEDERVAAQVRRQYKWFTVDEFQDVSPLQSALLDLWLGGRDELCVVGDPAQTIYSFAGADADYLRDFPRKFPGTTSVELVRNYRSTPQVVSAANTLLSGTPSQGVELRAQRPVGPEVTYTERSDEVDEAEAVASEILRLHQSGRPYSEIAVLFRINAQSETFEEALAARRIPYVVRGAARFFDRPEVREAVTRFRGAARSGDGEATGEQLLETVHGTLAGMGWTSSPPEGRGQTRDRWESWQALIDQAQEFAAGGGDLAGFVADLDRRAADQHAPVADGVTLATFHAAKGLEWDSVFLVGLQDGTLPYSYSLDSPAAVEEERRLLYVGVTRARVDLALSWALARQPGGRASRKPSRFLDPLLPDRPERQERRAGTGRARMCKTCGQPLGSREEKIRGRHEGCPAAYDEELYARLRAWRKETADAISKPAFVVFTDATLEAIAERKPGSLDDLLRVSGVGRSKLDAYGEDVLALVAEAG